MSRVKRGVAAHRRHKKIISQTKGFRGKRKNVFKLAKAAVMKKGTNSYVGRKLKKREFHQLWVLRINAACRDSGIKYSRFIYGMELAGIEINRKMLAELAISAPEAFKEIVEKAKSALPPDGAAPDLGKLREEYSRQIKPVTEKSEKPTEEKAPKTEEKRKRVKKTEKKD